MKDTIDRDLATNYYLFAYMHTKATCSVSTMHTVHFVICI